MSGDRTIYHNSRDERYRSPMGACPAGGAVTLAIRAEGADSVTLRLWWRDREQMFPMPRGADGLFRYELKLPTLSGLLWYYFIIARGGDTVYYGNAADGLGGEGLESTVPPESFQITVYDAREAPPAWMRDAILYQIMPDRFCAAGERRRPPRGWLHERWDEPPELAIDRATGDNEALDFFGGNLRGIESKLDYLQSLGVTALYLNPIFEARSNHKYDTGDYMKIDPSFGDEADFTALCRAAEARGMRVLLDGVFSHTGSDSRYFNRFGRYKSVGAYQSRSSMYSDWYRFQRWPDEYDCWWGIETLPNVDELEPSHLRFTVTGDDAVVAHWLRRGAAGWRLDVADELPMPFLRLLRRRVKAERPDSAVIGEVWEDASHKNAYGETRCYFLGDTLDSVMNYPLREGLIAFMLGEIDAFQLKRRLDALYENYPQPYAFSLMNMLGTHDKARVINRLSGEVPEQVARRERRFELLSEEAYQRGKERFIALWRFVCALPGMPCLYYGDEAGAQGGDDPFCRGTFPWGREDKELLNTIAALNRHRHESPLLRRGALRLEADGKDRIVAVRELEGEEERVALAREKR